jgi:hypothetical protein
MISDADRATHWLEQRGVRRDASGKWAGMSPTGRQSVASANDVAHDWTDQIWLDDAFGSVEQGPGPAEQVAYSLWVDWFEDRAAVESAFCEVLSADVIAYSDQGRLSELASGALPCQLPRHLRIAGSEACPSPA